MDLSIIIVSWNTRQILEDCLKSIYSNPPAGDFEILVIDNCSSDGSAEMVKAFFPQARLIVNTTNLGFAGANNQGIRLSQGRYILLLNSDTLVKPGAFETLVRFMDDNLKVGVSGARLFNQDGSLQVSCYPCTNVRARDMAVVPYGSTRARWLYIQWIPGRSIAPNMCIP